MCMYVCVCVRSCVCARVSKAPASLVINAGTIQINVIIYIYIIISIYARLKVMF